MQLGDHAFSFRVLFNLPALIGSLAYVETTKTDSCHLPTVFSRKRELREPSIDLSKQTRQSLLYLYGKGSGKVAQDATKQHRQHDDNS